VISIFNTSLKGFAGPPKETGSPSFDSAYYNRLDEKGKLELAS